MLTYELKKSPGVPLYEALYRCIRGDILSGSLRPGEKLPSKRALAENLEVSKITVEAAYSQLLSEGYICSKEKVGYFVETVEHSAPVSAAPARRAKEDAPCLLDLTANGTEQFPFSVWSRLQREVMLDFGEALLAPLPNRGIPELRQAIAGHLAAFRGMRVDPENILIGAGTDFLYNLLIQLLGREKVYAVREANAKGGAGPAQFAAAVRELLRDKLEAYAQKGQVGRVVRVMVLGIPNVGKSTFINTFAGKACAKTGNKPGVTKGKQWIRLNKNVELLDTPGILWPKFEDQSVGLRLALIGSIKDDILNIDELSLELIQILREEYPGVLKERYGMEEEGTPAEMLEKIALNRGCIKKGNEVDYAKAAALVLDEFRTGKLGKISLEKPEVEA